MKTILERKAIEQAANLIEQAFHQTVRAVTQHKGTMGELQAQLSTTGTDLNIAITQMQEAKQWLKAVIGQLE